VLIVAAEDQMFRRRTRSLDLPALAGAMLLGAALALLLDPRRGAARRAHIRQKAGSLARRGSAEATRRARDLAQRARGKRYEIDHARETVADDVLVERVRAQIGKRTRHASALRIEATAGTVVLAGPVLRDEVEGLVAIISKVRGVKAIEDRLEVHDDPANVPGLRG
jgi:osmotically-inducible protein OsmY